MKHLSILAPAQQTSSGTVACIIGALQIFTEANNFLERKGQQPIFNIEIVGTFTEELLNDGVLTINKQSTIADIKSTNLIIIPASMILNYDTATASNQKLIEWIKAQYKQGSEIASMCIGGFTLAATGLLSGKTCSVHWSRAEQFRTEYPDVNLQTDKLITDENGIYTNGGGYSFLNLLLYLVEKFYGKETAIHCTKYFQIDSDRRLQAEFSVFNGHKKHSDEVVLTAQIFIEAHYSDKISFEQLSSTLTTGRRNFDRRFIKATGLTPLDYLQRVRVDAAKKSFETSRKSVNEVMYEVGYNDTKAFREVFGRVTGLSPTEYKSKYNSTMG